MEINMAAFTRRWQRLVPLHLGAVLKRDLDVTLTAFEVSVLSIEHKVRERSLVHESKA